MKIQLVNIIHVLIIWQSLLFALVLISPKYKNKKSNTFLSLILLTLCLHFIYNILYTNGYFLDFLPAYSCSYGFLYGPLAFLYIRFQLLKDARFKPIDWLHFLSFMGVLAFTSVGIPVCGVMENLVLPMMLIYSLFAYWSIIKYQNTLPYVSSKHHGAQIKSLKLMIFMMLAIVVLNMIQMQRSTIEVGTITISMEVVVQVGILIFVNLIIYQGMKSPHLFQQITTSDIQIDKVNTLSADEKGALEALAEQIEDAMKTHQLYLNPDLNIDTLATFVDASPKAVSQAINQVKGNNFSSYVNYHRIEEAKAQLKDKQHPNLTIKEVMYDVGFNSRSVFNTVFKKQTGFTPSEYKKQHQ